MPRVIIVGGGVGGVSAAQQLAKANFADVTVIDRYDDHASARWRPAPAALSCAGNLIYAVQP